MGQHTIEDCSTYSTILLLTSWYVYAIYGSCLIISDNSDKHCYVAQDSITASSQLDPSMD